MFHPAQEALAGLFGPALDEVRYRSWRRESAAGLLDGYAFGQIHWRAALGRPKTPTLAEGFAIEAMQQQWTLVPVGPGVLEWQLFPLPREASLWDGTSDAETWRVNFVIGGLTSDRVQDERYDTHTAITPSLVRGVAWTLPGGEFGIAALGVRRMSPPAAGFVKDAGPVYLEFEVVLGSFFRMDEDGVLKP